MQPNQMTEQQRREYEEKQYLARGQQNNFDAQYSETLVKKLAELDKVLADTAAIEASQKAAIIEERNSYMQKLRDQLKKAMEVSEEADRVSPIPGFTGNKKALKDAYKKVAEWKSETAGSLEAQGINLLNDNSGPSIMDTLNKAHQLNKLALKRDEELQKIRYGHGGKYEYSTVMGFLHSEFKANLIMTVGPNGLFNVQTNAWRDKELVQIRDSVRQQFQDYLKNQVFSQQNPDGTTSPFLDENKKQVTREVEFDATGMPYYKNTKKNIGKDENDKDIIEAVRVVPEDYKVFIDLWKQAIPSSSFANPEQILAVLDEAERNYSGLSVPGGFEGGGAAVGSATGENPVDRSRSLSSASDATGVGPVVVMDPDGRGTPTSDGTPTPGSAP